MTYFAKPGVLAVTPVTFPLVFVFSAGQAGCTGSHFCLTVAGHQVFDEEQQQLIAGMSPATIQLAWQSTAGETPGAVLSVGRHRVGLSDNDITVYRFAPRDEAWPQDSDWDRLLYTVFKGEAPEYLQIVSERDDIFKNSDYVSVHVPAAKDTIHSISDREFELMKDTAYLINTARGSIVDEPALIRALEAEKIAGAGLDVLEKEPLDPENPLLKMENVLTAPHIGGATKEAAARASVSCAEAIDDFFSGRTPKFVIPEMRDMI